METLCLMSILDCWSLSRQLRSTATKTRDRLLTHSLINKKILKKYFRKKTKHLSSCDTFGQIPRGIRIISTWNAQVIREKLQRNDIYNPLKNIDCSWHNNFLITFVIFVTFWTYDNWLPATSSNLFKCIFEFLEKRKI